MLRKLHSKPWMMFGTGLTMGLLLGLGAVIGMMLPDRGPQPVLPETLLHAMATHGSESFAMATGLVDEDMEGVFFLDTLTGELQCWVLGSRTGKWTGVFKCNIVADLGVERGKKPNYLLVTGMAEFSGGGAANQMGNCVAYVMDANSGAVGAYVVPWNKSMARAGSSQVGQLTLLTPVQKARSLEIRE